MPIDRITFPGASGHTLAARLDRPVGPPRAVALFAHCFTCSKDSLAAARIARALTDHDIAVLRFDFTGLGDSEGEFAATDFSGNVDDLVAAAAHLRATVGAPSILVGHSLGGAAVLVAASQIPETRAVATIGAPFDPQHVAHLFGDDDLEAITADGQAKVSIGGRSFTVRKAFLDDLASQRSADRIGRLGSALLVMHAPEDAIVGIANASRIFQAACHPRSFVSLDGADHLLTGARDARYVASVLAAWAARYLDDDVRPEPPPHGVVEVRERGVGRFQQTVRVRDHALVADEPTDLGGDDEGPNPYDLLLSALGACTSMTLRMYADRKGWPLDHVSVHLTHDKIHAEDCAECATTTGKIDRIGREITLTGDLDEAQREKLLEIANKCPVHRTLHSEIQVVTTEVG